MGRGGVAEKKRVSSFAGVFKEDHVMSRDPDARKAQMRAIFDRLVENSVSFDTCGDLG